MLERERLEALNVNGLDLVLFAMNLTIELVAAHAASPKEADERLIDVANKLEGMAREITEPRMRLLVEQFSHALIATEPTG